MIIVNDRDNLPNRFAQFPISKFKGHLTKEFLDRLVAPNLNTGVKRNNYWLLKSEGLFRFNQMDIQATIIMKLIEWAQGREFKYLMFIDK